MELVSIRVESPCRLHITLIDMHGSSSGRVDGGAGIALSEPGVILTARKHVDKRITVESNSQTHVFPGLLDEIRAVLHAIQKRYDLGGIIAQVESLIPAHSGFGSKTQTLLSAAVAYSKLYNATDDLGSLASHIGRGGTSGIGVQAFISGGFIVDCGHSFKSKRFSFKPSSESRFITPAPLVGRYRFPDWPIMVVVPIRSERIHGKEEQRLFNQVCPIPLADVQTCSHIILMMLIPAVIEANLEIFCKGVNLLQDLTWKRFEIDAQTASVRETMRFLREIGLEGVGMSSWGAAVFCLGSILNDQVSADETLRQVREFLSQNGGGQSFITKANNSGAKVIKV